MSSSPNRRQINGRQYKMSVSMRSCEESPCLTQKQLRKTSAMQRLSTVPELPHCMATELFKSNTGNGILAEEKSEVEISSAHLNSLCLRLVLSSLNPIIFCHLFVGPVTVPDVTTLHCPAIRARNMPHLESRGLT